MNPYDAAHALARALRESSEYREFIDLKEKVKQNTKTADMLKDFRKKQFSMQTRQLSGQHVPDDEIQKLQNLQNVLLQNPLVGPYLHAEYRMTQTLNDIYKILGEAVDLDLENDLKEFTDELKKEAAAQHNHAEQDEAEEADKTAAIEEEVKED